MRSRSSLVYALALALAAPAASVGCGRSPDKQGPERVGTLSAALATTGSDGATYTFPDSAYFTLFNGTWNGGFPLNGAETVRTQKLPVGSYTLGIVFPEGPMVLVRTIDGVTSNVPAEWTDPQPVTFEILQDQTTPVVLHFHVEGLGDVTFANGTLELSVDVIKTQVTMPGSLFEVGTVNPDSVTFADPAADYAPELAATIGTDYQQALIFAPTAGWTPVGFGGVCMDATVSSAIGSGVDDGFSRRVLELQDGIGEVCIYDYGASDFMTFYAYRSGPAPIGQQSFLPASYNFQITMSGSIGDVFDGTTLKQSLLETGMSVVGGNFMHYVTDPADFSIMTSLSGVFTGTFQLAP